uniref:C2 domain-containing protein n=1 Tax=Acrobeloides nanus TaxID=290746 RepID=A0A914CZS2_9BILA
MLRIELFDEDTASADEELGRLSIPLDIVRQSGVLHRWFHLEGCKHGELHLKCSWYNLSTDLKNMAQQSWESEWLSADKPMHPALLMVFVDNVSELPYPKADLEPSPFIEVTLGRTSQRTPVKMKTVNPLFQSKFTFFVKQPEGQELKFVAYDDGTKRAIGELTIPLLSLMNQPNMEMFQNTFTLTHGVHTSPIVLTIRLRTFASVAEADTFFDQSIGRTYGTASHIERADSNRVANNHTSKPVNGDVISTEPAKTVDNGMMLDAHNINLTVNSPSIAESNSSTLRHHHGLQDRIRRSKHGRSTFREGEIQHFGDLQLGLRYDDLRFKLIVHIVAARNLNPVEKEGQADPYVSVKLYPVNSKTPKVKRKTGVVENSLSPHFDNQFELDIHYSDLHNYKLQLQVKDAINYGVLSRPPILGTLEFPLENFNREEIIENRWFKLEGGHT